MPDSVYHELAARAAQLGTGPPHYLLYNVWLDKDSGKWEKRPIGRKWQETPRTADEAARHHQAGKPVGVIPSSLGLVVVDVDQGGEDAASAVEKLLGPPLGMVPSATAGHFHLYYRADRAYGGGGRSGKYEWEIVDVGSGEVLSNTRAAVLHNPQPVLELLDAYEAAQPVDLAPLPRKVKDSASEGRNNRLYRQTREAARRGDAEGFQDAAREALEQGLPPEEVDATVDSAVAGAMPKGDLLDDPHPGGGVAFNKDHRGVWAALDHLGLELRRNSRTELVDLRRKDYSTPAAQRWYAAFGYHAVATDGWIGFDDYLVARLMTWIADNFVTVGREQQRLTYGADAWRQAVRSLTATRGEDPVRVYLEGLPPWDGHVRMERLFIDCLGAEDTLLNRAMARCLLIAGVRRTYLPGVKHDLLALLQGDQGAGKSTFCRHLVPLDRPKWFCDNVDMSESTQKRVESIGEAWIVEFGDMRGLYGMQLNAMLSYISRMTERYRPPWFTNSVDFPRRWVGIATVNDRGTGVLPNGRCA